MATGTFAPMLAAYIRCRVALGSRSSSLAALDVAPGQDDKPAQHRGVQGVNDAPLVAEPDGSLWPIHQEMLGP